MNLVEKLWAIEQIKQLKARFFRLLDTGQWDLWADVFTLDVEVVTDGSEGPRSAGGPLPAEGLSGRDALVKARSTTKDICVSRHHGHMPEIEITGPDTATGIWAMFCLDGHAGGKIVQTYGWYHEEYRLCADGKWRISKLGLENLLAT
jgi:SnoaL-like domain